MQRKCALATLIVSSLTAGQAFAGAFQIHTSQGEYPRKENERPLSLAKALLKIDLSVGALQGLAGFNNNGLNNCDPVFNPSDGCALTDSPSFNLTIPQGNIANNSIGHNQTTQLWTHIGVSYGLTDNWTFGFDIPFVRMVESYVANPGQENALDLQLANDQLPERSITTLGDMRYLLQYQFLRDYDGPTRSFVGKILMKMPTGNESPGDPAKLIDPSNPDPNEQVIDTTTLITSTGTTDADLGVGYKQQIGSALGLTVEGGYVVRFPDYVGYLFDESGVQFVDGLLPAAKLDLGDQVYARAKITISPSDKWYLNLGFQGVRWGATRVARARSVTVDEIVVDEDTTESRDVFLGPRFLTIPESQGFLVTTSPKFSYQPKDWIEIGVTTDVHLFGQNTNYVRSNQTTQPSNIDQPFGQVGVEENQFFPLQSLGMPVGPFILGETRLAITFKY
jgi:hypothetical protein